ncbi:MAG: histidine kinase [Bacteroidales bacterium]|nr:histidine kinase [Bacteroidales bacterium]
MNDVRTKPGFFRTKAIKVILHLIVWAIFIGLPLYFISRYPVAKDFLWVYYINALIWGSIFYINYLYLVPVYFFREGKLRYYLYALLLLVGFYVVSDVSNRMVLKNIPSINQEGRNEVDAPRGGPGNEPPPPPGRPFRDPFRRVHIFNYFPTALFIMFLSLGLKVLERQSQIEELKKEIEKEKLNSELAFLKNQISPHFFFNTLNNIYSLIGINQDDSQAAVLKLSKLMRYLIYDSEKGNTMLSHEIEFMNNYIDLMKLRMSDRVDLNVRFPEEYKDRIIQPLLFIPFVENSFKHGISYREKSFIEISMEAEADSIVFKCSNSLHSGGEKGAESDTGGIGLENVRKRLNLLFPGHHELRINKSDKRFDVFLEIKTA